MYYFIANSVARSLVGSYSSIASTASTTSSSCQTTQGLSSRTPRKEKLQKMLSYQKNKYNELQQKFNILKKNYADNQKTLTSLEHFQLMCDKFLNKGFSNFVKVQSKLTLHHSKGRRYSYETKQFALMIHFLGPKVYRFLQKSMNLPSPRTLQRTTENWEINPGLNEFLFKVLAIKVKTMEPRSKQCVLCVDEMSVKSSLYYDIKKDEIIGFHNTNSFKSSELAKSVMVIMIHGLNDSWKQPIGYFFVATSCSGADLLGIIFSCIHKLYSLSLDVRVMISDLGSNFKNFVDTRHITPETPYFNVSGKEIVFMFDPPHLLKATRNNFFNYRFKSENKIAEKIYLKQFYDIDKSQVHRLAPKLTDIHINPNSFQKMRVKYAAHVFSHTVVAGMTTLVACDKLNCSAFDTIEFIDSMDKLFDIFNSRPNSNQISDDTTNGSKQFCLPFTNSEAQITFLNRMSNYFKNLEVQKFDVLKNEWVTINRQFNIKFINSWLISIAGLIRLYSNLSSDKQGKSNLEICTCRLNQDRLENFFGSTRIQNGNCINPTCIQFKRTFKKLFVMNYFEYSEGANCVKDLDDILVTLEEIPIEEIKILFPERNPIKIPLAIEDINNYKDVNLPEQNALTYICGYLIKQCLKIHQCQICLDYAQNNSNLSSNNFYAHFKSYEQSNNSSLFYNLVLPNSNFYEYIFCVDNIFNNNFIQLAPQPNVGKTLRDLMLNSTFLDHPCKDFPKTFLINLFIRFRIYHTLNRTNKESLASRTGIRNRKVQILSNL